MLITFYTTRYKVHVLIAYLHVRYLILIYTYYRCINKYMYTCIYCSYIPSLDNTYPTFEIIIFLDYFVDNFNMHVINYYLYLDSPTIYLKYIIRILKVGISINKIYHTLINKFDYSVILITLKFYRYTFKKSLTVNV